MDVKSRSALPIEQFQSAARAFLHRKKRDDEDVLSEMVLYALEHPDVFVSVENAYLRAIDRLDPRQVMTPNAKKERHSWRTCQLACNDENDPLDSLSSLACEPFEPFKDIKIKGPLRAMLLLISVYGYSMQEVAWMFGLSPSRLSQMLGKGKAAVLAGGVADRDFIFGTTAFDLPWMTL